MFVDSFLYLVTYEKLLLIKTKQMCGIYTYIIAVLTVDKTLEYFRPGELVSYLTVSFVFASFAARISINCRHFWSLDALCLLDILWDVTL
jgi:hypothetical protein